MDPVAPYETTLATVAAGRAAGRRAAPPARRRAGGAPTRCRHRGPGAPGADARRPAPAGGLRARTRARRDLGPALAARLDPLVPAHPAAAVEVVATRPRAVPVEHHIGPHAPRAARTDGARVRERREVGLLGGRGRHARGCYHVRTRQNSPLRLAGRRILRPVAHPAAGDDDARDHEPGDENLERGHGREFRGGDGTACSFTSFAKCSRQGRFSRIVKQRQHRRDYRCDPDARGHARRGAPMSVRSGGDRRCTAPGGGVGCQRIPRWRKAQGDGLAGREGAHTGVALRSDSTALRSTLHPAIASARCLAPKATAL